MAAFARKYMLPIWLDLVIVLALGLTVGTWLDGRGVDVIGAVTAFATVLAAIYAAQAARASQEAARSAALAVDEARKASEIQIMWGILQNYAKSEMLTAIRQIEAWYDGRDGNLAEHLQRLRADKLPPDLDSARRIVSHHYQVIYTLWRRTGLLDERLVDNLLDEGQIRMLRQWVEPLEWANSPSAEGYNREVFKYLGEEYKYSVPRRIIPGLVGWEDRLSVQEG